MVPVRQERKARCDGSLPGLSKRWRPRFRTGVAQMIELEIEGLSAEEQRVLGAGSVMGIAFPAWAVAAALGEDQTAIEEACAGLARRVYFVERGGQDELPDGTRSEFYVFVHGLYREVLYRTAGRNAAREVAQACRRAVGRDVSGTSSGRWRARLRCICEAAGEWAAAAGRAAACGSSCGSERGAGEAAALLEDAQRLAGRECDGTRYDSRSGAWDECGRRRDERTRGREVCRSCPEKLDEFWTGS